MGTWGPGEGSDDREESHLAWFPLLSSTDHSARISPQVIFFFFLIKMGGVEYSCFTMLCECPLYSKGNQLYVHIHPLFSGFPSHLGHHRALSRAP